MKASTSKALLGPLCSCRHKSTAAASPSKIKRFTLTRESRPTFPSHFSATGTHCGVKKDASQLDLGLIVSSSPFPTAAAATFTKNAVQAAPVQVSKALLKNSVYAKAVVFNSGNANAVTGKQGLDNAWSMSKAVEEALPSKDSGTLVMSTGVIGQQLPIRRILPAIKASLLPTLSSSFDSWHAAAQALMTTDTFPKLRTREFVIGSRTARLVGMDKGAGMMHPRMGPPHATLLGFIGTDAAVHPAALQAALDHAVARSFNSISVDGDTSTNDTVVALANGAAWDGKDLIQLNTPEFDSFRDELTSFCTDLAKLIVWDGEGATKFVTITVEECPSYEAAHHIASALSTSMILKCAINGADANWGRVLMAIGKSDPPFSIDPSSISVAFESPNGDVLKVLERGEPILPLDEARALEMLSKDEVGLRVQMGQGKSSAT